jgi:hypothetical protein
MSYRLAVPTVVESDCSERGSYVDALPKLRWAIATDELFRILPARFSFVDQHDEAVDCPS